MVVQDIVNRVQSELEDATGDSGTGWTDADSILSKLATCSDDISVRLQLLDLNYTTQEIILPNIDANTEDLSSLQGSGQPLSQMMLVKTVEWRLVGQGQQDWTTVQNVDKLIDTDTGSGEPGAPITSSDAVVESYEWRGGVLKISPCSVPVDLRIRFVGTAISLDTDSQQQIVGLTNVYVYKCCEKICASRAVGSSALVEYFRDLYNRACADFEGLSVKTQQSKVVRLGGRRSGPSNSADSAWRPPIVG